LALAVAAAACNGQHELPGRQMAADTKPTLPLPSLRPQQAPVAASDKAKPSSGKAPFLASIAMRTWIYQQPDEFSVKLGYLRAGARLRRSPKAAGTSGCKGGWYAVEPRGYVCVGNGATLDLEHPVVQTVVRGPNRASGMPYTYVLSREPGPHLYFKLASVAEQKHAEGKRRARSMALFGQEMNKRFGVPDPIPSTILEGRRLPKPYGADRSLHYAAHRGRAKEDTAFGILAQFDWQGRRMGLTTELDLIPLDRTRRARGSRLKGIAVEAGSTPAFVVRHQVSTYVPGPRGRYVEKDAAPFRSGWLLTGKNNGSRRGLLETTAGVWLPAGSLRIAKLRSDPAGFARDGRKWIDVSIKKQLLVAYEGKQPVYATLVSTGRDELRDPETTHSTVRGTFMIHAKHVSGTMDGNDDTRESFDLRDVPYIQYFYKGYALHGAYWHDRFGRPKSHGCVNLAPNDAAWLFSWTEPHVPPNWHAALNHQHGTMVYIHP
jgi:hypothetical protein